ncbi:MAG TPA: L,D-transpeptidase [Mariprofundaceae bacterium]|nr:L,D-transpeptidase [Mariprofundaceae bacterium]
MIVVRVHEQMLHHRRPSGVWYAYPVSTAANGVGNTRGSFCTPLGKHRILQKIGDGMPMHTAFVGRRPVGIYAPGAEDAYRDWILTRILWLEGLETGINRRGRVDTRSRYIYIHGTHDEDAIGTPASHGCIRMRNADIVELFSHCREGERVLIRD